MKKLLLVGLLFPMVAFATFDPTATIRNDCDGGCHSNVISVDANTTTPQSEQTGAEATPFDTIQEGIDKAEFRKDSGHWTTRGVSTVCVNNGSYVGKQIIDFDGLADEVLVIRAVNPADTAVASNNSPATTAVLNGNFRIYGASNIAILGFDISNPGGISTYDKGINVTGPDNSAGPPSGNLYLIDNYIHQTYSAGIYVMGSPYKENPGDFNNIDGVLIKGNLINDAVHLGSNEYISVGSGAKNVWVVQNHLEDTGLTGAREGGEGIDFKGGVKDSVIANNYIKGLRSNLIYIDGGETSWPYHEVDDPYGAGHVNDNGTPYDLTDDFWNQNFTAMAITSGIQIYGNKVILGSSHTSTNAISVMGEGTGSIYGVDIYNNIVIFSGLPGKSGISIYDHPDGKRARELCSRMTPAIVCADMRNINIYNNTVAGRGDAPGYLSNYRVDHGNALVTLRNNISAHRGWGATGTSVVHFQNRNPVAGKTFVNLSNNWCSGSSSSDGFCAFVEPNMGLNSTTLKPSASSNTVNKLLTGYPATDIDGTYRPRNAYPDAGAHEQ